MSVQPLTCAYQKHIQQKKSDELCEQFTPLSNRGVSRSVQNIIVGYVIEVSCMSCRQVKEGGEPTLAIALAFFKGNILRENTRRPGTLIEIQRYLDPDRPRSLPWGLTRTRDAGDTFDLFVTNSWRYSLFTLYPVPSYLFHTFCKTCDYETRNEEMPKAPLAFEQRLCFHGLVATCPGQSVFSSTLPDVADKDRDKLEDEMQKERNALTTELVAAHQAKKAHPA